jgi:hypothetical protein
VGASRSSEMPDSEVVTARAHTEPTLHFLERATSCCLDIDDPCGQPRQRERAIAMFL